MVAGQPNLWHLLSNVLSVRAMPVSPTIATLTPMPVAVRVLQQERTATTTYVGLASPEVPVQLLPLLHLVIFRYCSFITVVHLSAFPLDECLNNNFRMDQDCRTANQQKEAPAQVPHHLQPLRHGSHFILLWQDLHLTHFIPPVHRRIRLLL